MSRKAFVAAAIAAASMMMCAVATAQDTAPAAADAFSTEPVAAADVAPEWRVEINPHGLRTATAQGIANFGSMRWPATLTLQCAPGHDGALVWKMEIAGARDGDGFDFGAFEGPDAPANGKQLTQLALEGGLLTTRFATTQTGSWSEADRFAFEVSARAWDMSNGALLADAVGSQTQAILWSMRSPAESSQVIVARFGASGAQEVLRSTMSGCGPAPKIDAAALKRWADGDDTGLWKDRAMQWRLQGVLGARYDTFAQQNWPADAVKRDGDVYYALATPDANGNGAALMFNAEGILEALLVEAGNLQRYSWYRSALKPPQAVRDYLSGIVKSEISPPDVN
jgi:hypothetical protein